MAVESTGGGYYKVTSSAVFEELLEDIRLTETSAMEDVKTLILDYPQVPFILLLVFVGVYFIFSRKVRL